MSVKINKVMVDMLLAKKQMKLRDLAKTSNIGEATLYRVVNAGAPFTSDTLAKLASALECNPIDLIDPEGFASPLVGAPAVGNVRA